MVILWTVRISQAEFDLLMQGKTLEKLLQDGLLIIEQDPDGFKSLREPCISIKFLTREEAGLRFGPSADVHRVWLAQIWIWPF